MMGIFLLFPKVASYVAQQQGYCSSIASYT